ILHKSAWLEKRGWIIGLALITVSFSVVFYPEQSNFKITLMKTANFAILAGITLILPVLIKPLSFVVHKLLFFVKSSKVASRNLSRAKLRSALTISALLIGLVMVIGIEAMNISYQRSFEQWINSSINIDLFIRPKIGYGLELGKTVPMDIGMEKEIKKTKGVKEVTPVKFLQAKTAKKEPVTIIASRPEKSRIILNYYFFAGNKKDAYDKLEKGNNVIISTALRDNYGYKMGDSLSLKTTAGKKKFEVVGIVSDFVSEEGSVILAWQDLKSYFKTDDVDVFDVDIRKGYTLTKVKKNLEEKVSKHGVFVMTTKDINRQVNKDIATSFYLMDAIVLIALIVAAFGIVNTLTMSVMERKREIGILRALGSYAKQVGNLIIVEAVIIGLIGSFIGIIGGLFAAYFMIVATSILTSFPVPYTVPTSAMILGGIFAIVLSVAAGIYPAYRAAKTNIVRALHYE
ncbi:MAG: ABC transporter permease, partial [Actinobacteria bacterium]